MGRRKRLCPAGYPAHVIQRRVNRQNIFAAEADYTTYASHLADASEQFDVGVHGWVFMTNHTHLLLTPRSSNEAVSRLMHALEQRYVSYFTFRCGMTGPLFEGPFKSCLIEDNHYLMTCLKYIELNPVRAGIVDDPGDYKWSTF